MKDYKRELRRHAGRMKYIRRLKRQITWWDYVLKDYGMGYAERMKPDNVLYMPKVAQIIGSEFEKHFHGWKNTSCPCSCSACSGDKYRRDRMSVRREILKQLEDEGCGDRVARIH